MSNKKKEIQKFLADGGVEICPYTKPACIRNETITTRIKHPENPQNSLAPKVKQFIEKKPNHPKEALIIIPIKESPKDHYEARDLARKYFVELLVAIKKIEYPEFSEEKIRRILNQNLVSWDNPTKRNEINFKGELLDVIALSPFYKGSSIPRYAPHFFLSAVWHNAVNSVPQKTRNSIRKKIKAINNKLYDARELYIIPDPCQQTQ